METCKLERSVPQSHSLQVLKVRNGGVPNLGCTIDGDQIMESMTPTIQTVQEPFSSHRNVLATFSHLQNKEDFMFNSRATLKFQIYNNFG